MDLIIKEMLAVLEKHGYSTEEEPVELVEDHLSEMLDTLESEGFGPSETDFGDKDDD